MLKSQPAAGNKIFRGFLGYFPDGIQSVFPRSQGYFRLKRQVAFFEMRVALCYIRWIADDQLVLLVRCQRFEEAALMQADFNRRMAFDIDDRDVAQFDIAYGEGTK